MDNQEANTQKHIQTLISMSWLQSTLQKKKKFPKTADRNGARGEVTYHFIDRRH